MEDQIILTENQIDVIGEIMNISMGAAATAVSSMLEKQVTITTPQLQQEKFGEVDCSEFEPAVVVKIKYVEGFEGENVIMFRRRDMQVILNLLMGNDFISDDENFEFDDMSMSAACEVMNQMMGASSTALSEILGFTVNISTPEAILANTAEEINATFNNFTDDSDVVSISFKMMIKDVLDTTFASFMPPALVKNIVKNVMGNMDEESNTPTPPVPQPQEMDTSTINTQAAQPQQQMPPMQPPVQEQQNNQMSQMPQQAIPMQQQVPPVQQQIPQQQVPSMQQMSEPQQQMPQMPPQPQIPPIQQEMMNAAYNQGQMPMYQYPGYPQAPFMPNPYQYGYIPQQPQPPKQINVQSPEFPGFSTNNNMSVAPAGSNMNLLMGVQLDVSVVIGHTKRKIKDIMDFGQGTVIELDKQTGAPAEIVVNGQLLAYGDVIVVGDNFGIRVTEIVGSKELLDSLANGTEG